MPQYILIASRCQQTLKINLTDTAGYAIMGIVKTLLTHIVRAICGGLLLLAATRTLADPLADFLGARQAVKTPLLGAASAGDILRRPDAYTGRTVEAAALVSGIIAAGDDKTALLSVSGTIVTVPVPPALRGAQWLNGGAQVRVLLRVAPADPSLPSGVALLAAVPEGEAVNADRAQARLAARVAPISRPASLKRGAATVSFGGASVPAANAGHPVGALSARALSIYGPYRALVRRWNRRLSENDVDKITTSILYFSDKNNVDPRLVVATIIAESDFDIRSTSHAGAMGLAQIMPDEAHSLGVTNAYDPIQNIGAAVHLLRGHLDKYGGAPAAGGVIPLNQIALTMAAYNAGPGAVRKYHGVPPYRETQRYVARIKKLYQQMCGDTSQSASTK